MSVQKNSVLFGTRDSDNAQKNSVLFGTRDIVCAEEFCIIWYT